MYANIYISNGMLISIYHNLKAYFVSLGERFIKTKFAYPFIFLMGLIEAIIFPFPQEIFMVPMMALDKKKIFKRLELLNIQALQVPSIEDLASGKIHSFTGPIYDQKGNILVAEGKVADDGMLLGMNVYVKGVEGDIPK